MSLGPSLTFYPQSLRMVRKQMNCNTSLWRERLQYQALYPKR